MLSTFRNGQWVKWDSKLAEVHRAADGKAVGIFRKGDGDNPAHIVPVNPNGENIPLVISGVVVTMHVGLDQPGLVPVLDRADIPAKRLEGTPPNWQPRP